MRKQYVKWLTAELPDLVARNILSPDAAARLRDYYGGFDREGKRTVASQAFAILAAILIGAGIILLLAHNWDEFSRPLRAVISFIPLLAAQSLAGWGIWRGKDSRGWREGVSIFWMLAMGSSLALISQTYHISSDPDTFTLSWMLLSIPIVYLVGSGTIIPLYLIGITIWAGMAQSFGGHPTFFWLLIALPLPRIWKISHKDPYRTDPVLLRAVFTICLIIGTGIILEKSLADYWIVIFSSLFAITYLVGRIWFADAPPRVFLQPLRAIGSTGLLFLAFAASFRAPWKEIIQPSRAILQPEIIPALMLPAGAVALLLLCRSRFKSSGSLLGVMPLLALAGTILARTTSERMIPINIVLFTAYIFILGLANLLHGIKERNIGLTNLGLVILCLLIVVRFFDSDLGFTVRGVAFIVTGIGFLLANFILLQKKTTDRRK